MSNYKGWKFKGRELKYIKNINYKANNLHEK